MKQALTICVVSDTHWLSGSAQTRFLAMLAGHKPDLILHAGDWTDLALLDELQKIAPVQGVAGNCDQAEIGAELDYVKVVQAGPVRLGLTHGHFFEYMPTPQSALRTFAEAEPPVQAVVFGHSHVPLCQMQDGVLLFNPGSAVRPLGEIKKPSYGLLHISEAGEIEGEIIYFDK